MPVKSAFNKKPLITLGIIALLFIGIIVINVSCSMSSAKMDKPQTQTTTTPIVEQNRPTETKQEVVKEETGNTVVEEATTNSVDDVIKPYQLPVLDIKTKLGLTRDDKDNKIVSYF